MLIEYLTGLGREGFPLGNEVVPDKAEGALGEKVGADVKVAGVPGAQGEGMLRESVLGYVGVCGGKDGFLGLVEDARRRWVIV